MTNKTMTKDSKGRSSRLPRGPLPVRYYELLCNDRETTERMKPLGKGTFGRIEYNMDRIWLKRGCCVTAHSSTPSSLRLLHPDVPLRLWRVV